MPPPFFPAVGMGQPPPAHQSLSQLVQTSAPTSAPLNFVNAVPRLAHSNIGDAPYGVSLDLTKGGVVADTLTSVYKQEAAVPPALSRQLGGQLGAFLQVPGNGHGEASHPYPHAHRPLPTDQSQFGQRSFAPSVNDIAPQAQYSAQYPHTHSYSYTNLSHPQVDTSQSSHSQPTQSTSNSSFPYPAGNPYPAQVINPSSVSESMKAQDLHQRERARERVQRSDRDGSAPHSWDDRGGGRGDDNRDHSGGRGRDDRRDERNSGSRQEEFYRHNANGYNNNYQQKKRN